METYTIHHHPPVPGFTSPPVVALVRLAEGPLMISNIVGPGASGVTIGDEVMVVFVEIDDDYVVPQFARIIRDDVDEREHA
ncbi:hypothetical protein BL253_34610 [Pseudofrankia asymbiotica]|uniref:ChsH2 C-terminal OB-fold domain-containing protein n=1 Tax=Pseudofrankia asymbiotica TaxID=1834516 RepID=A0A1V2I2I0_9ACTN|nr:hypothetical protein BL253_34610 [Pseudofrankia asymbiotica]